MDTKIIIDIFRKSLYYGYYLSIIAIIELDTKLHYYQNPYFDFT